MAKFLFYFQYLSKNTKTNSMRLYSRLQYLLDKHGFHTYRRRRESCTHTFLPLNYNSSMRLLGFFVQSCALPVSCCQIFIARNLSGSKIGATE